MAFLARYSGRTMEAYRQDLRCRFQWAADHGLAVLASTRTHLELASTFFGTVLKGMGSDGTHYPLPRPQSGSRNTSP